MWEHAKIRQVKSGLIIKNHPYRKTFKDMPQPDHATKKIGKEGNDTDLITKKRDNK